MEQLSFSFKETEEPDAREWLIKWGKEHDYPKIRFIFGIKNYAFVRADEYIYSQPSKEGWERIRNAPDFFINRTLIAIQTGLFEIFKEAKWQKYQQS